MADFIKLNFLDLNKFISLTRSSQIGVIKRSIRATVNDQAFSTQKQARFKEIPNSMTTRGKFNQSLIRVTQARNRSLTSLVGAINKGDYRGLRNIELGKTERNVAIPHIKEVRGGNKKKKVVPSKRLRRLGNFVKISGSGSNNKLKHLSLSGYKGYFQVEDNSTKLPLGIYRFSGKGKKDKRTGFRKRKLIKVRNTEEKRTTPKINKWLFRSTKAGSKPSLNIRFWIRNQNRFLKKAFDRKLKKA